jgi:hypothetical protein
VSGVRIIATSVNDRKRLQQSDTKSASTAAFSRWAKQPVLLDWKFR